MSNDLTKIKISKYMSTELKNIPFALKDYIILEGYRGSRTHGTTILNTDPNGVDDVDIMGVFIAPPEYYVGLKHVEGYDFWCDEFDCVYYELKKFLALLAKGNPNVISLLWLDSEDYFDLSVVLPKSYLLGRKLIDHRELFLSKKMYYSFSGYAYSQLKRMSSFSNAYKGYMGAKRKALVDKYGYDVKNGAHLIRLLRMGIETLNTGDVFVKRKDAQELIDIKTGKWSLLEVQKEAERLFPLMEEAKNKSKLPDEPDYKKINELCVNLIKVFHGWDNETTF